MGRLGLAIALLIGACSTKVDFGGTDYQCPDGVTCPDGFVCFEQRCVESIPIDAGTSDAPDAGEQPALACGEPTLIRSDFESGFPWWGGTFEGDGGTVEVINGRLRITSSDSAGAETRFGDRYHTAIRGNRFTVEILDIDNAELAIGFYENRTIEISLEGTDLVGRIDHGGTSSLASIPYDSGIHRFFSIAEEDGTISTEVSQDGTNWTTVHERVSTLDEEFGHFDVSVRSLGSVGTVELDNYNGAGTHDIETCEFADPVETFDDSTLEAGLLAIEGDCAKAITGGILRWTMSNQGGAEPFCTVETIYRVDARGKTFGFENVTLPTYAAGMYHNLAMIAEGGEAYFYVDPNTEVLNFEYCDPNCSILGSADLDPVAHRFWRFRHDGTGLFWEISANGTDWTDMASVQQSFDLASTQLELTYGSTLPQNTIYEIDNFGPI